MATVPVLTVARTTARHEGRTGHGNDKAHDTRRGQQQVMNERTMKEEQTRKKISERNENNEA
ncbi:TPA: hypothetical protein ACIQN7_005802 [Bacillus cereus]